MTGKTKIEPKFSRHNEILNFVKNNGATVYHAIGSCRMGVDKGSVVAPNLKLNGIKGLRIADGSVLPHLVSSNTNAPILMIGERCSEFVIEEFK